MDWPIPLKIRLNADNKFSETIPKLFWKISEKIFFFFGNVPSSDRSKMVTWVFEKLAQWDVLLGEIINFLETVNLVFQILKNNWTKTVPFIDIFNVHGQKQHPLQNMSSYGNKFILLH